MGKSRWMDTAIVMEVDQGRQRKVTYPLGCSKYLCWCPRGELGGGVWKEERGVR